MRNRDDTGSTTGAVTDAGMIGAAESGNIANTSTAAQGPIALATPRYNDNAKPAYPRQARLRGEQGMVLLLVRVSEVGRVSDVRVVRSSGFESLDEAALTAVKRWTFHPARRGDKPVEMSVHVPVHFRLEK
jgi:protein TonB